MIDDELQALLVARFEEVASDVGRLRRRFASHAQTCAACAGEGYADVDVWTDDGREADELCPTCRGRGKVNPAVWSGEYVADRMAAVLETCFNIVQPSAGELVASLFPGDDATAAAAVEFVDARTRRFRRLLAEGRP